ncbi:asparagine synthase (glutamine-hydrolyzing) [Flavobacterium sp. CYK-55]|uniref:asparagine synthase (glutamine-hydrolyzing) n=1 Tax=Flavobacterium sp. CYK-55 TaxID=2835529 RepID=UPI001BD17349|nr:asparagine synthase (glutamine-hydrolyzing) [Flavobacterium sp. CYK-55]MBS7787520.1 asparagine synthase (glutamine-hydrolyzing) [Flavobacterium sp. CYK-55]
MCGILGAININFNNAVLDSIKHRGPDYGEIQQYEFHNNTICFGHRRLSIVDLSPSGNQPMNTPDNQFSIIFNGEIYNHLDLQKKIQNVDFAGHSDTETIINYIAQHGIKGVSDFNGIFAIGLLDRNKGKIYLARDPFGVKPLYYYLSGNKLIFSSEIRPIKKMVTHNLDEDSLSELLKLRYNPSPDTLYSNILKLRPGHVLEFDLNTHEASISSYIKTVSINTNTTFSKAIDQYGILFEKAIKRQLMADVEIGTLLSGGVDSALVTYFVQQNSKNPVKTYTVGFEDNDAVNELEHARETSLILGTNHHQITITKDDFRKGLEKISQIVEEPIGTTSIVPMYYLNQEVAKTLKVVLTGQGADEPLGGYTRYKGEIYRKHVPNIMFDLAMPFSKKIRNEQLARSLYALGENDIIKRFEKIYTLFGDDEIFKILRRSDKRSYERIAYFYELLDCKSKNGVEAMMSIDTRMNLADDLLLYTDKVSMNFGLETRVPLLDTELIAFIESLPYSYRIKNGVGKYIHKEFAKTILPESIVNRKKLGFQSPTREWFKGDMGADYYNELKSSNSLFFEIFDKQEVLNFFKIHQSGINKEKQIFLLLSLYYWFKNA